MSLGRVKVRGSLGQWYAEAGGERLPCLHAHWLKQNRYCDPNKHIGDPRDEAIARALAEKGRCIITQDIVSKNETKFERTGYVGIFGVKNVELTETELKFELSGSRQDAR